MEGNRKLAVSFGSFACVLEGFDDPFALMQDVVGHFQRLAAENPGFGRYDEIADFDALRDMFTAEDREITVEPIAGGVYVRRIEAPSEAAGIAAPSETRNESGKELGEWHAEDAGANAEHAPETVLADAQADTGDDNGSLDENPEVAARTSSERVADAAPDHESGNGEHHEDRDTPTGNAERDSPESEDDDQTYRPEESASEPRPAEPAPLMLTPKQTIGDEPDEDQPAAADRPGGALRLGPEFSVDDDDADDTARPSFVDTLKEPDSAAEPRKAPPPSEEELEKLVADTDTEAGNPAEQGGRIGGFFRRREEPDTPEASAKDAGDDTAQTEEPAKPPRQAAPLRVIDTGDGKAEEGAAPQHPPAEPPSRLRSFLRGRQPQAETPPPAEAEPAPIPAEAVEPPAAETPRAARAATRQGEANPLSDRLHASFSDLPDPTASTSFRLEGDAVEDADPSTPRGFARALGATALPELMTAAAGYMFMMQGRPSFSRNEIMEVVSEITGNAPISAEAKVKAFGKLIRNGDLVRLDAGQFMLSSAMEAEHRMKFADEDDL